MRKLPHRKLFKFILILLGCIVLFQIAALRFVQEKTFFSMPKEISVGIKTLTFAEEFDKIEQVFRNRFGPSWATDIFVPAIEIIRFQGIFWIVLMLLPFLKISSFWNKAISTTFFVFSSALFIGGHGIVSYIVIGAITLNIVLWYYRSFLAPFVIHAVWNLLQPILYPLSLI